MLLLFHTVLGPFKQRKQSKEEHSILYMLYIGPPQLSSVSKLLQVKGIRTIKT